LTAMKTIIIKNLVLQFDGDDSDLSTKEQVQNAIEQINGVLQREPYGLGAQIMSSGLDDSDIEVSNTEQDEEDL